MIMGDRFGRPWVVGIRHPDDPEKVIARIPMVDAAISTSGDYERYFDEDGKRYHHIINPQTGKSAGEVRSVTIIGPDATTTDGLSTSVFVMGPERGIALIERLGDVDAVIRMTGCPNNCARPSTAEIGIYGYGKNDHVVLVGGSREGTRIAQTLYPRVPEEKMVEVLVGLLRAVREHNPEALPAGEFLHRTDPERLRGWVGIADLVV
jgi:hypothetical protein